MSMLSRDGSLRAVDNLIGVAKRNPEGVLLLAAGCALLMRGLGAAAQRLRDPSEDAAEGKRPANGRPKSIEADKETHGFADSAREHVSELAGRVRRSADAAAHYAADTRRAAFDETARITEQARSGASDGMRRMLDEQPLALALFGLAAGALFASALPGTQLERRALAPIGETAADARVRLRRSASRARQRMGEVAEERGLTSEGLKQAAREVADAFGNELLGDGKGESPPAKAATPRSRTKAKPGARGAKKPAAAQLAAEASHPRRNGASEPEPGRKGEAPGAEKQGV